MGKKHKFDILAFILFIQLPCRRMVRQASSGVPTTRLWSCAAGIWHWYPGDESSFPLSLYHCIIIFLNNASNQGVEQREDQRSDPGPQQRLWRNEWAGVPRWKYVWRNRMTIFSSFMHLNSPDLWLLRLSLRLDEIQESVLLLWRAGVKRSSQTFAKHCRAFV